MPRTLSAYTHWWILVLRSRGHSFRYIEKTTGASRQTASRYCKGLYFFIPKSLKGKK